MESQATLAELGRKLFLWLGVPGIILTLLAALVFFRDSYAVAPDKFDGLESAYQQTAAQVATNCRGLQQSTIDGLRTEIRKITTDKVGAKPEVVAVLLALEQSVHKLMAKAETEKAKC